VDVGPARSNTCSASTSARVGQSEVVAVTAQNNVKWFIAATTTPAATMVKIFAAIWAIP
jgi:hypothetical protein